MAYWVLIPYQFSEKSICENTIIIFRERYAPQYYKILFTYLWQTDMKNYPVIKERILVVVALLVLCPVFLSHSAVLPVETDDIDTISSENIFSLPYFDKAEADAFGSFENPGLLHKPESDIVDLVRSGIKDLDDYNIKLGLDKLERAWAMDTSQAVAGAVIFFVHLKANAYASALEIAQRLQSNAPKLATGYTLAGIAYAGLGKQNQMQTAFEKALEVSPGSPQAGTSLATLYFGLGNAIGAKVILADVLLHNPDHLKATLMLAEIELRVNQPQKTMALLQSAKENHPDQLQPYLMLAQLYIKLNMPTNALAVLQSAMTRFPDNIELLELAGVAYIRNGTAKDAVIVLEKALKQVPDATTLHYNLALAYELLKRFEDALQEIEMALKLEPEHAYSQFLYAKLLARTGQIDLAEKRIQELGTSAPENYKIKELEGNIALMQNKPTQAILLFQKALKIRQKNTLIIQLAKSQFRAGEDSDGYETLRNWLTKYPEDILVRSVLADLLLDKGKYNEAQQYYAELVNQNPDNLRARNNLAWLLVKQGDYDNALAHAEYAHEKAPDNAQVMDTLGGILLHKGQAEKSVRLLQKAADKSPESPSINYHLAQALVATNKNVDAKKILNTILAQNKPFKEYQQAQELLKKITAK